MDFASSTMAAEDRTRWKGIVVKSSGAPMTSQGYGIGFAQDFRFTGGQILKLLPRLEMWLLWVFRNINALGREYINHPKLAYIQCLLGLK